MKKILLIEDDKLFNESLHLLLSLSCYQVLTTFDGRKGIEMAIKESPDLIICDIMMPILDGYAVMHILNNHPKTAGIPVIFITGNADFESQRRGMNLGADDYLIKPINSTDLLNSISTRLAKNENLKRKFRTPNSESLNNVVFDENFFTQLISDKHEILQHKKKHVLYAVGQRPTCLYFVKSGTVKEYLVNDDGKELITKIYAKGDFFGYLELFKHTNYLKNASLMEDSAIVLVPKDEFLQKVNEDAVISRKFISLLSESLMDSEEVVINVAYNSLRKKVASGIARVLDKTIESKDGKQIIDICREDLANVVGSSQESLIRTLKEFKCEQLIDVIENGNIVVLNEVKIRNLKY